MLLNRDRATAVMKEVGADILLATTPQNVIYLTDFDPWIQRVYIGNTSAKGMQIYGILNKEGDGALVGTYLSYLAQQPSWIQDVYPYGPLAEPSLPEGEYTDDVYAYQRICREYGPKASNSPAEALLKALRAKGAESATIALDTEAISPAALARIKSELPNATIKDGGELFRYIRAIKTPEEIERLRYSAAINELAIQNVIKAIAVGVSERELALVHKTTVIRNGAVPEFINVPAGKRAGTLWEPSDYRLQPGDMVWIDGGCIYKHYHSDTGTQAVLGEPSSEAVRIYDAIDKAMEAVLGVLKPGVKCSVVQNAANDVLKANGLNPFGFGHAVGIEPRDVPLIQGPFGEWRDDFLKGSNDLTIEPNMVLNFELPTWRYGLGGLQREHTVLVTFGGWELLTPQTRKIHVVG